MRRIYPLSIILLFLAHQAPGQVKTFVSVDAGPSWDISRVQDMGNMFANSFLGGTNGGFSINQEVFSNFYIGSGLAVHGYKSGINPSDRRPSQVSAAAYRSLLVPVRVSYRFGHQGIPLFVTPRLGYQVAFLLNVPEVQNFSSLISNEQGTLMQYNLLEDPSTAKLIPLIEAGISLEYVLPNNWMVSASFIHLSGFRDSKLTTVDYLLSGTDSREAIYSNDGSRMDLLLSLHLPVSNLWQRSDARLYSRIEQAYGRNSSVRKIRYLYFGGEFGTLWRSFSTTNPAIGPRPVDDAGLFRYANFNAGGYAGYMFKGYHAVDIGAIYQRSGTFLAVMYDHESDLALKRRAPMFIEIPVMYKYYIDARDNSLFVVPQAGIAAITHLSGPAYDTGSEGFTFAGPGGLQNATADFTADRISRFGIKLQAGVGLDYALPVKTPIHLAFNLTYSHGIMDIDRVSVSTSVPETPEESYITYNGTGWKASLGARIPILLGKENRKCGAMPRIR